MSPADRIAVSVKCQPLLKDACMIIMGVEEYRAIVNNTEPCADPDYKHENGTNETFCGVPLKFDPTCYNKLQFVINIPNLNHPDQKV